MDRATHDDRNRLPKAVPVLLGWREWIALPDLGLPAVRAKIDSGARSSALHVDASWRFSERGAPWVGFRLSDDGRGAARLEAFAPVHDTREVIDSGGHRTRRLFIRTRLALAGIEREIEINLTDRRGMLFPMLLGRTAMSPVFTVDPARSYLHGRPARRTVGVAADLRSLRLVRPGRVSDAPRIAPAEHLPTQVLPPQVRPARPLARVVATRLPDPDFRSGAR